MLYKSSTLSLFVTVLFLGTSASGADPDSWPQWRGGAQNGVAFVDQLPQQWSEQAGVAWKTPIPGVGGSTPVTSDGSAFVTAGHDGKNKLLAVDLKSGKLKWTVNVGNDEGGKHRKGSGSNPSAVAEDGRVFAYFRSGDFACVSTEGKILWQKNLQEQYADDTLWWDLGTSPLLMDSAVVIAVMQSGPSYLAGFDKATGKELWRTDRMLGAPEEAAQSYATPLDVKVRGRKAIAVMGADHLTLHDAASGKELGRLGGFNPDQEKYFRSISSPVAEGNLIVCPYARGSTITCVNMDRLASGKGKDAIAWFRDDLGSDVPTPAVRDSKVYVVGDGKQNRGVVTCVNLKTGKTLWDITLPRSRNSFSSSPLIGGDFLFVTQENATTYVIGPLSSDSPKLMHTNKLEDDTPFTVASPVPSKDGLLIRSRSHLYKIGS